MLFLINPWKFRPQVPPRPLACFFFWNSPMTGVLRWHTYLAVFVNIGYVVRQTLKILGVTISSSHMSAEPMSALSIALFW